MAKKPFKKIKKPFKIVTQKPASEEDLPKISEIESPSRLIPTNIIQLTQREPEISIALAWQALLDQFRFPDKANLNTLSTLSTIIYKLTASHTQLKALDIKKKELLLKEEALQIQEAETSFENTQKNAKGLTPETLRLIEQQLKLL